MAQADIILYTNHRCPWAHRAHIVLSELGLPFKEEIIDLDTPRTPEYLKVNPRGLVPSISYNGEIITESAIVAQFLADANPSALFPASSDPNGALVRARIAFFVDAWSTKVGGPFMKSIYGATSDSQAEELAGEAAAAVVKEVEPLLEDAAPFFGGSSKITLAEALTGPFILRLFSFSKHGLVHKSFLERLEKDAPNFHKWAQEVIKNPSVISIYNEDLIVEGTKSRIAKLKAQAKTPVIPVGLLREARTPLPYFEGRTLTLKTQAGKETQAAILRRLSMTMSPVLEVRLKAPDGEETRAVLKLYDRRFGDNRLTMGGYGPMRPHTPLAEDAWKQYISSGMAKSWLNKRRSRFKRELPKNAYLSDEDLDDLLQDDSKPKSEMEECGEFECKMYYETQSQYDHEVKAYEELKSLQGRSVPKFLDSVVVCDAIPMPPDLPALYFQVPGILIEHVQGFSMGHLIPRKPDQPLLWEKLIQDAIDLTSSVNQLGVFHYDSQPRNFLVKELEDDEYEVYMIDFAQCGFRWYYKEVEDMDDEMSFAYKVWCANDGNEIGSLMGRRYRQATGRRLSVIFPFRESPIELG
ncbi:hypothetical protein ACJ41O_008913 [Fusarium nematophilum]